MCIHCFLENFMSSIPGVAGTESDKHAEQRALPDPWRRWRIEAMYQRKKREGDPSALEALAKREREREREATTSTAEKRERKCDPPNPGRTQRTELAPSKETPP